MLKLETVKGCMRLIASGAANSDLHSFGISDEDFKLVTADTPYIGKDRMRFERVFNALVYGCADLVGLPRVELPAEYLAAAVSVFISPTNYYTACSWIEKTCSATDIGCLAGDAHNVDTAQLFSLVCQVESDCDDHKAQFQAKTDLIISHYGPKEEETVDATE